MTIETVHIPKTATLTIVLEGREIQTIEEEIETMIGTIKAGNAILKERNVQTLSNFLVEIRKRLKSQ